MPGRTSATVASHRARRRGPRWLMPTLLTLVVLLGVGAVAWVGFDRLGLAGPSCTGQPTSITVASAGTQFQALSTAARNWTESDPSVDGKCVTATVVLKDSSEVAAALGPAWDEARDGPHPDVWVPDSSLWLQIAASRKDATAMLPSDAPSIASSPIVLAVRRPVAEALGWPQRPLAWEQVLGVFATPTAWKLMGHPEWATLRMGMTDPTLSTAGLASTLAILDRDANGKLSNEELTAGVAFTQLLGTMAADTTVFINEQREANGDPTGVAAFPVIEKDVATYNATKPALELVPVYAPQGAVIADFPYAVLNADWVDATSRSIATKFLEYLRSDEGVKGLAAESLRAPDLTVHDAAKLPAASGFLASVGSPRPNPDAGSVSQLITDWTALQRQSNILAVLDTSGSMDSKVPGSPMTRLQLLKQTAAAGFALLNNRTNIGLWQFSSNLTPTTDYRELVPYGPLAGKVGKIPRKDALLAAVQGLKAAGGTGLYDTTYAAFRAIQKRWEPNDTNAILLITDGRNEEDTGLTLAQLVSKLAKEGRIDRPVPVISIAVGPDADAGALRQISKVTGGRTFVVRDPNAAVQTLILAFAGRLS